MSTRNTIRIFRIVCLAVLSSLSVPASAIWAQTSPVADDSKKVADQSHNIAAQDAEDADEEDWSILLVPKGTLQPSGPCK